MSQLAMLDLGPSQNSLLARCRRAIAHFFGFGEVPPELRDVLRRETPVAVPVEQPAAEARIRIVHDVDLAAQPSDAASFRWRRHPQLRNQAASPLPRNEREARNHGIRALYAARAEDLETARHHFALAAAEPTLDLCDIPGFWKLSRGAMLVAVDAYEDAGRFREASALAARIRTKFRPRALTPVPTNVTELPERKLSFSSGG